MRLVYDYRGDALVRILNTSLITGQIKYMIHLGV